MTRNRKLLRWPIAIACGAVVAMTLSPVCASAQDPPELTSLRPASSPAFIVLGVSPTSVSRPNTPADVAFGLVTATDRFQSLPSDLAVEFSPFWLTNRQDLTWEEDIERTPSQSFWRTLAFSLASTELGDETTPRTGLAFGGRTLLYSGRVSQESVDALRAREGVLRRSGTQVNTLLRDVRASLDQRKLDSLRVGLAGLDRNTPAYQRRADSIGAYFESMRRGIEARLLASSTIDDELNALEEIVIVREGPLLEIAGAGSWMFTGQEWESGKFDRWGFWATYSCERCRFLNNSESSITPMLLARYLQDVEGEDTKTLDTGGRIAANGPRYSFSLEGVRRTFMGDTDQDPLWRFVGNVEYEVADDTWLVASFGRDHESPREGDLIAQFGVKLNVIGDRFRTGPGVTGTTP